MHDTFNLKSSLTVGQLIDLTNGKSSIPETVRDLPVNAILNDSRLVGQGDVFVALKSETGDGHDFVASAVQKGALAAVVCGDSVSKIKGCDDKLIAVDDSLLAIQRAAATYRKTFSMPVVAITGSNGKTTTRQFVSHALSSCMNVSQTWGNWNNHIGVPLCLLHTDKTKDVLVLEMGANHEGEIDVLSRIGAPDIALISNIGFAHIGNFGSLARTVSAKAEIVNGMDPHKGMLLYNGDDKRLHHKVQSLNVKSRSFGFADHCDFRAENLEINQYGVCSFTCNGIRYSLSMPGRHFVYSALCAISVATLLHLDLEKVSNALVFVDVDRMRGRVTEKKSFHFIVDCYNANPSSMLTSLQLLKDVGTDKWNKCAILADMMELGRYSQRLHRFIGKHVAACNLRFLITVGKLSHHIARGARDGGMSEQKIISCDTVEQALVEARTHFTSEDLILLKGSNSMKLGYIFENF